MTTKLKVYVATSAAIDAVFNLRETIYSRIVSLKEKDKKTGQEKVELKRLIKLQNANDNYIFKLSSFAKK